MTLNALELCCGIGGASLGLHEAGFSSVGVDNNYKAVGVARKNGLNAHELDLFDEDAVSKLLALQPNPDLIWASPSCRGYSQASNASIEHKAVQNALTTRAAQIIQEIAPPLFIIENVLHARRNPTFAQAIAVLNRWYHTASVCLDACKMDVGVPQSRKRLFVIGVRTAGTDLEACRHMQAFISRCEEMMRDDTFTSIGDAIPEMQGRTLFQFPRRRENQAVFGSHRPAPTIRSMCLSRPTASLIEPNAMNHGAISDAVVPDKKLILKLCGFPAWFEPHDEKVAAAVQLGNVVCPPQGAFVAKFVRTLHQFAGEGDVPGIALQSRYAIRPVRLSQTREQAA